MTVHAADVSILVTQPSPEVPVGPNLNSNQTLVHHVIVHRESEEYHHNESEDTQGAKKSSTYTYVFMFTEIDSFSTGTTCYEYFIFLSNSTRKIRK